MSKPTHDDAMLVIELAHLSAAQDASGALSWVFSDAFIPEHEGFYAKYPVGSPEATKLNNLLGWFETVGTLYRHGLINENLLFDWLAVNFVWEQVKTIVKGHQAAISPAMYENFEAMAAASVQWTTRNRKKRRKVKS